LELFGGLDSEEFLAARNSDSPAMVPCDWNVGMMLLTRDFRRNLSDPSSLIFD
jgi:hypothetical protein